MALVFGGFGLDSKSPWPLPPHNPTTLATPPQPPQLPQPSQPPQSPPPFWGGEECAGRGEHLLGRCEASGAATAAGAAATCADGCSQKGGAPHGRPAGEPQSTPGYMKVSKGAIPAINSCGRLSNSVHGSGFTIFVAGFDCDSGDVRSQKNGVTENTEPNNELLFQQVPGKRIDFFFFWGFPWLAVEARAGSGFGLVRWPTPSGAQRSC